VRRRSRSPEACESRALRIVLSSCSQRGYS
jgi:hypothetical protein